MFWQHKIGDEYLNNKAFPWVMSVYIAHVVTTTTGALANGLIQEAKEQSTMEFIVYHGLAFTPFSYDPFQWKLRHVGKTVQAWACYRSCLPDGSTSEGWMLLRCLPGTSLECWINSETGEGRKGERQGEGERTLSSSCHTISVSRDVEFATCFFGLNELSIVFTSLYIATCVKYQYGIHNLKILIFQSLFLCFQKVTTVV